MMAMMAMELVRTANDKIILFLNIEWSHQRNSDTGSDIIPMDTRFNMDDILPPDDPKLKLRP